MHEDKSEQDTPPDRRKTVQERRLSAVKDIKGYAKKFVEGNKGAWADPLMLTGYDFSMCVKLYKVTRKLVKGQKLSSSQKYSWISRFFAYMTTCEVFYPQQYQKVKPFKRIFFWPEDVTDAVGRLNLVPRK